jgi:hypothetical protein
VTRDEPRSLGDKSPEYGATARYQEDQFHSSWKISSLMPSFWRFASRP